MRFNLVEILIREFNYRRLLSYLSTNGHRHGADLCPEETIVEDLHLELRNVRQLIAYGARKGHLAIGLEGGVVLTQTKGEKVISSIGFILTHPVVIFLAAPVVSGAVSGVVGTLVRLAIEGSLK